MPQIDAFELPISLKKSLQIQTRLIKLTHSVNFAFLLCSKPTLLDNASGRYVPNRNPSHRRARDWRAQNAPAGYFIKFQEIAVGAEAWVRGRAHLSSSNMDWMVTWLHFYHVVSFAFSVIKYLHWLKMNSNKLWLFWIRVWAASRRPIIRLLRPPRERLGFFEYVIFGGMLRVETTFDAEYRRWHACMRAKILFRSVNWECYGVGVRRFDHTLTIWRGIGAPFFVSLSFGNGVTLGARRVGLKSIENQFFCLHVQKWLLIRCLICWFSANVVQAATV